MEFTECKTCTTSTAFDLVHGAQHEAQVVKVPYGIPYPCTLYNYNYIICVYVGVVDDV